MAELKFPTKKNIHDIYFILFDVYQFDPIDMSVEIGSWDDARSKLARVSQQFLSYQEKTKDRVDGILLPLQTNVTESVTANYTESSMKNVSSLAESVSGGGVDALKEVAGRAGRESIAQRIPGIEEALSGASRKAINQQMQIIYEGPQKRKYSFEFTLVARNRDDSVAMKKIKNKLQFHASPRLPGNGTQYFVYPNMVRFQFLRRNPGQTANISAGSGNKLSTSNLDTVDSLFTSKYCYIESVNIEHGEDRFQEFTDMDGNTGPARMTISVELMEAEYMLQDDFAEDED